MAGGGKEKGGGSGGTQDREEMWRHNILLGDKTVSRETKDL
jgi:hypothetical protein